MNSLEATNIPIDFIKTRSWILLHQPLYHTYGHHDASGLATWTQVLSGHKFWVAIQTYGYETCQTRKQVYDHNEHFHFKEDLKSQQFDFEYTGNSDCHCIFAEKGDLM